MVKKMFAVKYQVWYVLKIVSKVRNIENRKLHKYCSELLVHIAPGLETSGVPSALGHQLIPRDTELRKTRGEFKIGERQPALADA